MKHTVNWRFLRNLQVAEKLTEIGGLELTHLQFHHNKGIQLAIEEQKIRELLHIIHFEQLLIANEREICAEA